MFGKEGLDEGAVTSVIRGIFGDISAISKFFRSQVTVKMCVISTLIVNILANVKPSVA